MGLALALARCTKFYLALMTDRGTDSTQFGIRIGNRKWNRGQLWANNLVQHGAALCSISQIEIISAGSECDRAGGRT